MNKFINELIYQKNNKELCGLWFRKQRARNSFQNMCYRMKSSEQGTVQEFY